MLIIILFSPLVLYLVIMTVVQYGNIKAQKEKYNRTGKTHNQDYEDMSFEEQQAQFNLQGNLLNLPSTLVATLIYWIVHPKKRNYNTN